MQAIRRVARPGAPVPVSGRADTCWFPPR